MPARFVRTTMSLALLAGSLAFARPSRADGVIPPPVELPPQLALDQAIQILKTKSLDVLIAEAAVKSAEGDLGIAGMVPNPAVSGAYGRVLPPYTGACNGCSADQITFRLSDQAAIEDTLSG